MRLTIFLTIAAIFTASLPLNSVSAQGVQTPSKIADYNLGLAYVIGSRQKLSVDEGYSKIAECCDLAYIQGSWDDWLKPELLDKEVALARSKGLKVYAALDILSYKPKPRADVGVPKKLGIKGDFTSAGVRSAYLDLVRHIASADHPDYFVVLVEANLHKKFNQESFAAFKELYPTVVTETHRLSPSTKVAASIVYGDLAEPKGFDDQDKQYFVQSVQDFDALSDLLAVSTYPKYYLKPQNIPISFLADIASVSRHPLFISETSWVSREFKIPFGPLPFMDYTFKSSPEDQAAYVQRLANCASYAQLKGARIEAINFTTLIDPSKFVSSLLKLASPALAWFCYLGLLDSDGNEKPAYGALKQWKLNR